MPNKVGKKIGYALGGGGARGLAHIGVLKVLEKHGVFPDVIAGTSIGALVGALYASGLKAAEIEQIALHIDWKRLAPLTDFTLSRSGFIRGRRIVLLLESILGHLSFSELKLPFACVATDIMTGEEVVLRHGSVVEAVRATISIPGILTPARIGGRHLVDGGLVNEVPVSTCRHMGAEYVIGINVIPDPAKVALRLQHDAPILPPENRTQGEELTSVPHIHGHSMRSRLQNIESVLKTFILEHQAGRHGPDARASQLVGQKRRQPPSRATRLPDVLSQSVLITGHRRALENLKDADLAISPAVERMRFWQFDAAAEAIEAGEKAAEAALRHAGGLRE